MYRVASHQPAFLPWAGFWHKAASVDAMILTTGVKWSKDGYLHRTRHQGAWLTLPTTARDDTPILSARVGNDTRLLAKAVKTLQQQAGPYKSRLDPIIRRLSGVVPGDNVADLNNYLIMIIAGILGIETRFREVPAIPDERLSKTMRLWQRVIGNAPGATDYFLGEGALDYIDADEMRPLRLHVQQHNEFASLPSIVQLIACEHDPLDLIMSKGSWAPLT